jgi:protein-disulfide isomerase
MARLEWCNKFKINSEVGVNSLLGGRKTKISVMALLVVLLMVLAACSDSEDKDSNDAEENTPRDSATEVQTEAIVETPQEVVTEAPTEVATEAPTVEAAEATPTEEATEATPVAVAEATSASDEVETSNAASEDEPSVWNWPEWGLKINLPAGWEGILDSQFEFVLAGPPDANDEWPYVLAQKGPYDPALSFREFIQQIAGGDNIALTETTFAGIDGLRFEVVSETNTNQVTAIPYPAGEVTLVVAVAKNDEWETWRPIFEEILASATITPLELDVAALNQQMQTNVETTGLMTVGDPNAPLWIAEFMDFSCPHCFEYREAMARLVQDYVATGKAQFTLAVVDFIGLDPSTLAAKYQICGAKMGVGWTMHDVIFGAYAEQSIQAYTAENLTAAVSEADLGIDMAAFETCLADEATAKILADTLEWRVALDVTSTPSLMIGSSRDDVQYLSLGNGEPFKSGKLYYIYPGLDALLANADAPVENNTGVFGG